MSRIVHIITPQDATLKDTRNYTPLLTATDTTALY